MPSPNIPDLAKARQDPPLPDSRIGAFEPSLYGMIIHASLALNKICNKIIIIIIIIIKVILVIIIIIYNK